MPNVVEFLAAAGRSAHWRDATGAMRSKLAVEAGLDAPLQEALLDGDRRRLETLLGQAANICCLIYAPQDDEREDDEPAPDQSEK